MITVNNRSGSEKLAFNRPNKELFFINRKSIFPSVKVNHVSIQFWRIRLISVQFLDSPGLFPPESLPVRILPFCRTETWPLPSAVKHINLQLPAGGAGSEGAVHIIKVPTAAKMQPVDD